MIQDRQQIDRTSEQKEKQVKKEGEQIVLGSEQQRALQIIERIQKIKKESSQAQKFEQPRLKDETNNDKSKDLKKREFKDKSPSRQRRYSPRRQRSSSSSQNLRKDRSRRSPSREYRRKENHRNYRRRSSSSNDNYRVYRNKHTHHRSSSSEEKRRKRIKDSRRRSPSSEDNRRERYKESRRRSSSSREYKKRQRQVSLEKKQKKPEVIHPYFKKQNQNSKNQDMFWDGFQWVTKSKAMIENERMQPNLNNLDSSVSQVDPQQKIYQSKVVIVEGIPLHLGLTAKDVCRFLLEKLRQQGDIGPQVQITNIEIKGRTDFMQQKTNLQSVSHLGESIISVQLLDSFMAQRLKRLDQTICLGKRLTVRRYDEETVESSAAASAIAIKAFLDLQSGGKIKTLDKIEEKLQPIFEISIPCSPIVKIMNAHNREINLTQSLYEELFEDMKEELESIEGFKRVKVIKNEEERLGAEKGSIFAEFHGLEGSEKAMKKLNGRIYDGRKITVVYVDETVYFTELFLY